MRVLLGVLIATPVFCGSIEGTVTNAVTGEPVGGVQVRFLDRHSIVSQAVTDANGFYRLDNLQAGDYSGEFLRDGFQDVRGLGGLSHVTGDLGTRVDVRMDPWGSLRGRVIDEDGNPAAKVRVECGDQGENTDENGEFVCGRLWAASYTVVAKPEPSTRVQNGVRLGTVPVYYPSATEKADAVPVKVPWGQEVAGITIRLRSVPVWRITGRVLDTGGKPVVGATVKLMGKPTPRERDGVVSLMPMIAYSLLGGNEPEIAQAETLADGSFEFAAVEPGEWRLSAEADAQEDKPRAGVIGVTVADGDIGGIRIGIGGPFAVPVGAKDGAVRVLLRPMEGQPHVNLDPAESVGWIQGIYQGRYGVIDIPSTGPAYVAEVMRGGRDVLGQIVEFGEGSDPLQIVMRRDAGSVSGTVESGEGASVVLVRRETGEALHYRVTQCGAGGAFAIANVVPGDYYAVAVDSVPRQGLPAANLAETIPPLATAVRVEAGSTATVNLRKQEIGK